MASKSKIVKLKEYFWKKYTEVYNLNQDAFESMRLIGVEQGEYIQKTKLKKEEELK